jgi:heterodisulfide reductase subunit A-like polyferredoxin
MKTIKTNGRELLVVGECKQTVSTLERFGSRYKLAVWSKNGGVLLTGANLTREQVMGWNSDAAAAARALSNPVALEQGRKQTRFAYRADDEQCVIVKKCTELVRFGAALRAAVMEYRTQRASALCRRAKALKTAALASERTLRTNEGLTYNPFAALVEVS